MSTDPPTALVVGAVIIARIGPGLDGGWRQTARNSLLRHTPAGLLIKAGAPIVHWTPP